MSVIENGKALVDALIPPHNGDGGDVYRWRINVAIVLGGTVMGFIFFVVLAFGGLTFVFPGSGFASAQSVLDLRQQDDRRYADQLDNEIINLRINHCQAIDPHSPNRLAAREYWAKISSRMDEWYQIKKYPYPLPPCQAL